MADFITQLIGEKSLGASGGMVPALRSALLGFDSDPIYAAVFACKRACVSPVSEMEVFIDGEKLGAL